MHIVFLAHPLFLGQQSMPRYARMLADGMKARGHTVSIWSPKALFFKIPVGQAARKWLGYIDQFLIFPFSVRRRARSCPSNTLFVFTDHALGPYVPIVAGRPHVIHCHDFMALQSAEGKIAENPTSWTGRQYQRMIKRGFCRGRNFISISRKTQEDLHSALTTPAAMSEVVYNGLHYPFFAEDAALARDKFGRQANLDLAAGYILHVGGNSFYKNRIGVLEVYNVWRERFAGQLPLVMIGSSPTPSLLKAYESSPYKADIHWLTGIDDEHVAYAYSGAAVFLFPSLGEGFGWPIAEAMASGCPVVTTDEAPMTEVAGDAGFLIPRQPQDTVAAAEWTKKAADVIQRIVTMSPEERNNVVNTGLVNAQRFDTQNALNRIEEIYNRIVKTNAPVLADRTLTTVNIP
jgi:glycosyltransferase involved in cell wall biosynthesis